jgi:exopolyphosphatase/pppGpp-phosphohydrolase
MSIEEIKNTTICTKSADVVGGGCLLLYKIMEKLSLEKITVSESDNLEGYVLQKCGEK